MNWKKVSFYGCFLPLYLWEHGISPHVIMCDISEPSLAKAKAAEAENYECEIEAVPFKINEPKIEEADVVLLGPQVRFNLKPLQERYPDIPSEAIEMRAYGMCDGATILKQARKLLGDE